MPSSHLLAILVLVFSLGVYLHTLAPTVTWGDAVHVQMQAILGGSSYMYFAEFEDLIQTSVDGLPFARLGVAASDHPLHVMLGHMVLRLLPWGDPAYRLNLISACIAAVVVTLSYQLGCALVQDSWAAALGALSLAISHTFWFHAVVAEVYALHLLFMLALIWLAIRWPERRRSQHLMFFAFLAGLGLANHVMLILTIIPALAYMALPATLRERASLAMPLRLHRGRFLRALASPTALACGVLFLLGLAPWWVQFLRMARILGASLTFQLAAGAPWLPQRLAVASARTALENLAAYEAWLLYQFTPLGVALGVYGWLRLRRSQPRLAWLFLSLWLIHAAFSANYQVEDRFAFHLPSYLVFSLAIMAGLDGLLRYLDMRSAPRRLSWLAGRGGLLLAMVALPVAAYTIVPNALHSLGWTAERAGIRPIGSGARDALEVFLDPNQRGDDSAARFGRSTLAQLVPRALVFTPNHTHGETYLVLRYFQLVEGLRPDVHLELLLARPLDQVPQDVLALARALSGCRPLYLASLDPRAFPLAELSRDFALFPEANLYRLLPRRPRTTSHCPDLPGPGPDASLEEIYRSVIRWR